MKLRAFLLTIMLAWCNSAFAGMLVIENQSQATITCNVDGYTINTGWPYTWQIQVGPHEPFYIAQNYNRATPIINWGSCNGLTTRDMNITPDGPNGYMIVNGQQNRVLNVALYPYIPQIPGLNFDTLVNHVIATYQAQYPQVLLSAQMNQNTDIYSSPSLQNLLSANGLDVIEMDTALLGPVVAQNLVTPQQASANTYFPVGLAGATYNGQLYGIPSWLCTNFLFASTSQVSGANTLSNLLTFLGGMPSNKAEIATNLNGKWNLDAGYLMAYTQTNGYGTISNAWTLPPNAASVSNVVDIANTCTYSGVNKCVNYGYNSGVSPVETAFTSGEASTAVAFSERSFYILLNRYPIDNLYATALPWGPNPTPVLYSDSFVTNRATCSANPCTSDSTAFTTLMTSLSMKNYITTSADDPAGTPWRRLLVATTAFWQQPQIQSDRLYQSFYPFIPNAVPYPGALDSTQVAGLFAEVCQSVKQQMPIFLCVQPAANAKATTPPAPQKVHKIEGTARRVARRLQPAALI